MNDQEAIKAYLKEFAPRGLPREWFIERTQERAATPTDKADSDPVDLVAIKAEYEVLKSRALRCTLCELCKTRTNVVFDNGFVYKPKIAFVGEGPGADEDRRGEPFVGKAGQFLNAAISKGLKMKREDLYICNVVKCRPPQNRDPLPNEISSCLPYLREQLKLTQPQVIVTLGAPAMRTLTNETRGITEARGSWHEWEGFRLLLTLHPAYILRNPAAKRDFWVDLQKVMAELGIENRE